MHRVQFFTTRLTLPAAAALALAACGEAEEPSYEVDAEDLGGGELQVAEDQEGAVPVDLPEAEMTNVPQDEIPEEVQEDAAE